MSHDIELYDGAAVNYHPEREARIGGFLDITNFEYTIGSVHYAGPHHVADPDPPLDDVSAEKRQAVIDTSVERQGQLIELEWFEAVGHLDVVQRSPVLRGLMAEADYRRIARVLADFRTGPEITLAASRGSYGTIHPRPDALPFFEARLNSSSDRTPKYPIDSNVGGTARRHGPHGGRLPGWRVRFRRRAGRLPVIDR